MVSVAYLASGRAKCILQKTFSRTVSWVHPFFPFHMRSYETKKVGISRGYGGWVKDSLKETQELDEPKWDVLEERLVGVPQGLILHDSCCYWWVHTRSRLGVHVYNLKNKVPRRGNHPFVDRKIGMMEWQWQLMSIRWLWRNLGWDWDFQATGCEFKGSETEPNLFMTECGKVI